MLQQLSSTEDDTLLMNVIIGNEKKSILFLGTIFRENFVIVIRSIKNAVLIKVLKDRLM